jgi:hypothetical protein
MRLTAHRIRSINHRIAQAEWSAFSGIGRNTRVLPNALKPTTSSSPVQTVGATVLAKVVIV